jgi:Kdo2-lipid IVA lauroyltransferase/acyltransferase
MKAVIYYLLAPLIYLVSYLPFWWLYRLSDGMYLILYYLIGYRKQVVGKNLRNAFPETSEHERKTIERKYYRYLCDLIVETIKSLSITPKTLRKRLVFKNFEIFQRYYDQKRSIIIAMGHWGNWELGGARFAIEPVHKLYVIYHPLKNVYFDKLVIKMRSRLGNGLYPMQQAIRSMIRDKAELTATAFIADQTPLPNDAFWMEFMNQDTPVFTGTGKIANKMDYPVVYAGVKRIKRGYYEINLEDLVPNPTALNPFQIVELFTRRLEQDIKEMPETWLWSHRRWKHKRTQSQSPL